MVAGLYPSWNVCRVLCLYLIMCLLCGAGGQPMYVRPCRRQVCGQIPHLYCAVLTARHYERRFYPAHKHTNSKDGGSFPSSFLSMCVLVHVKKKMCDTCVTAGMWGVTWSRWWSPRRSCGWSPGPHSAPDHCHCPSATHALTCPKDKDTACRCYCWLTCGVSMWWHLWVCGAAGIHACAKCISFCSLSAASLDGANMHAHLCTACKEKALFEHVQWEDSICGR